jgi:hypothetical protein
MIVEAPQASWNNRHGDGDSLSVVTGKLANANRGRLLYWPTGPGRLPSPGPAHKLRGQAKPPASPWRAKDRSSVGQSVGSTGAPTLDCPKRS